jgi:hypothetical protein
VFVALLPSHWCQQLVVHVLYLVLLVHDRLTARLGQLGHHCTFSTHTHTHTAHATARRHCGKCTNAAEESACTV